jgi:alpha-D-ribose 1-methylphosphonate 5-triphosphate synthase subunit PhnG
MVSNKNSRRGSILAVLVVVMALLGLVVAGSVRPLRDEASLTTMRVETIRAFYAAESGTVITIQGYLGAATMPVEGSEITLNGQTVQFTQIPGATGTAVVHGLSGDAIRRIELELQ